MNCQDYREIVSAHIDGVLCTQEQLEVESHLQQCAKCKQMADWERNAKSPLKRHLSPIAPPPELRQKVLYQLEEAGSGLFGWRQLLRIYVPAFACLLVFVAVYVGWPSKTQQDIFAEALALYRQASLDPTQFVKERGAHQTANLFDLSPWGYELLGRQVRSQTTRLFVHKGPDEALLVAQEIDGAKLTQPRGSEVSRKSGKDFISVSEGGVELVAWQDNNVVCVLASNLPRGRMIALAEQIATRG